MKKVINIKSAGAIFVALLSFNLVSAQINFNTQAQLEVLKTKSLWLSTENGAGLFAVNPGSFTQLNFDYKIANGDYKYVQDGKNERLTAISAEGGQKLGSAYAWGKFSFNNEMQKGTRFNTQMTDPWRGMPYAVADANLSDFRKQDYKLEMAVATKPLFNKILFGLKGEYAAQMGAKQIDPRSEVYYYNISLSPGMAINLGQHTIGLNVKYVNVNQTSTTTNSDSQVNQDVYVLKGLGNSYAAVVGGLQSLGTFIYKGNTAGAALQYAWSLPCFKILAEGSYSLRVEDVISSPSKPKKEGTVREKRAGGSLHLLFEGKNLARLSFNYLNSKLEGIEYVQELDNTYDVQQWVTIYSSVRSQYKKEEASVNFDFFRKADGIYKWKGSVFTKYCKNNDLYIMPESKEYTENLYFGTDLKYNIPVNKKSILVFGAGISVKQNLDREFEYNGAEPNSVLITEFMKPDFIFMRSDYSKVGGLLSFVKRTGKSSSVSVNAGIDYYQRINGDESRTQAVIGLGFNF
jgi:hypothetical protein